MKKIIKFLFLLLFFLFILLFLNKNNMVYENENILTEEAIQQFEKDLQEGKEIKASNYIPKKKNYENKLTRWSRKCSNVIDKMVNHLLKKLLSAIDS